MSDVISPAGQTSSQSRRPALLLVDTFCLDAEDVPASALANANALLTAARNQGVPVLHSGLRFRSDGLDGGHYFARNPDLASFAGTEIGHARGLEPQSVEVVIARNYPSAFFGTSLSASLRGLGVDSVVIAGGLTSEGVRVTAIDSMQHGFLPIVAEDAVADRSAAAHDESLRSLAARYAEVEPTAKVLARIAESVPVGAS